VLQDQLSNWRSAARSAVKGTAQGTVERAQITKRQNSLKKNGKQAPAHSL